MRLYLIIFVIIFISCCSPVDHSTDISWRGETISSNSGKFLYGEHELHQIKRIVNDEGKLVYSIKFKHARENIIYQAECPKILLEKNETNNYLVLFKWKTGCGCSNNKNYLKNIITALIIEPINTNGSIDRIVNVDDTIFIKDKKENIDKNFDEFSSWSVFDKD
jgi:hypothetical protein